MNHTTSSRTCSNTAMKFLLSLVFLIGFLESQALPSEGECPYFENFQEFEVAPYLGRWYEIERFGASFEFMESCVTADYGLITDTMISVTNTALTADGQMDTITGNASATSVPGQLMVQFPGSPPGEYNVLYTDYNISSVYSCGQVGPLKDEFAWVLSRTRTIDTEALARAEAAFTQWGVDVSPFTFTYQGDECTYVPEP